MMMSKDKNASVSKLKTQPVTIYRTILGLQENLSLSYCLKDNKTGRCSHQRAVSFHIAPVVDQWQFTLSLAELSRAQTDSCLIKCQPTATLPAADLLQMIFINTWNACGIKTKRPSISYVQKAW